MELRISFPSGNQEDEFEMVILNNGKVEYVSMAE